MFSDIPALLYSLSSYNLVANRELGIGIVSYSPLGRGFFAGKAVVESLPAESLLV